MDKLEGGTVTVEPGLQDQIQALIDKMPQEQQHEVMERLGWVTSGYKTDFERIQKAIPVKDWPEMGLMSVRNAIWHMRHKLYFTHDIPGCICMTDDDAGLVTLKFTSEEAATKFMMTYHPGEEHSGT